MIMHLKYVFQADNQEKKLVILDFDRGLDRQRVGSPEPSAETSIKKLFGLSGRWEGNREENSTNSPFFICLRSLSDTAGVISAVWVVNEEGLPEKVLGTVKGTGDGELVLSFWPPLPLRTASIMVGNKFTMVLSMRGTTSLSVRIF